MLSLRKPTGATIRRQLAAQSNCDFTCHHPEITAAGALANRPHPYVVDHTLCQLGSGEATYRAAITALTNWQQFALGWLQATPTDTPIETGAVVAVTARVLGVWSVNFARIVYTIDDQQCPIRRFGFAYGTLPDHVEAGEERFLIEWDTRDDTVYYDIVAYSRPRHPLARLGYPFVRLMQKRFGRESAATMQRISANPLTRALAV